MATYYFNIINDDVTDDPEGAELANDQMAHTYPVIVARSLAADTVKMGHLGLSHRIEVANDQHEVINTVTFAEAVDIRP